MPALFQEVAADLLEVHQTFDVQCIVQQLNCLCVKPHGLSATIASKWPWANHYNTRRQQGNMNLAVMEDRKRPGDIVVCAPPTTPEAMPQGGAPLDTETSLSDGSAACTDDAEKVEGSTEGVPGTDKSAPRMQTTSVTAAASAPDKPPPFVVGLFGQYEMGKPLQYDYTKYMARDIGRGYNVPDPDTTENRARWFEEALGKLAAWMVAQNIKRVAFPRLIGCDLAGGKWKSDSGRGYLDMLKAFAKSLPDGTTVLICDREALAALQQQTNKHARPKTLQGEEDVRNGIVSIMMTGSRNWTASVDPFLDRLIASHELLRGTSPAKLRLSHGDAKGADTLCKNSAQKRGWKVTAYKPEWDKYRALGCVKKAGVMRNQIMIDACLPQFVIGFVQPVSRGTWDALHRIQQYAKQKNSRLVQVTIVREDEYGTHSEQSFSRDEFASANLE